MDELESLGFLLGGKSRRGQVARSNLLFLLINLCMYVGVERIVLIHTSDRLID